MTRPPSLFVSHGSPMMLVEDGPARRFFGAYGAALGRPEAILMVSAHWETAGVAVATADRPATIHDFYGFPEPLYRVRYPAPGAPAVAEAAARLLEAAGHAVARDPARGLDHGAFVPLAFMFPTADVPVAQLSIQSHLGARHHLGLGRALAPLRDDGVLVIGSGNVTHGLRDMNRGGLDDPPRPWVSTFADWTWDAIADGRLDDLVDWRALAPSAARNHPTDDHFLPILVALGAGGEGARPERIHQSTCYGSLSMDSYAFH